MVSSGHDVEALTDWRPPKKTVVYPPMLINYDGSRTFLMAETQPGSLAAVSIRQRVYRDGHAWPTAEVLGYTLHQQRHSEYHL